MNDNELKQANNIEQSDDNGIGRIEVVPEILLSIAHRNTMRTDGVIKLADPPNALTRRHNKRMRQDGILLELSAETATFDIFVIMDATQNIMQASRIVQERVAEGVNQMIGIDVLAVNIHIEDVEFLSKS